MSLAASRASARTRGKSDPIDALAVARGFLREPDLPVASDDEISLELKLLRIVGKSLWPNHSDHQPAVVAGALASSPS